MLLPQVLVIFVLYMYSISQKDLIHVIYLNMIDEIYGHTKLEFMVSDSNLLYFWDQRLMRYSSNIMLTWGNQFMKNHH